MDLTVDPRNAVNEPPGSQQSPDVSTAGLAVDIDRSLVGRGRRQESFWADCECPDDCPRDHGNE
ncbi:MAG TPA: hypothetical protein VFY18_11605 [Candidatus Limnocylindrales bacterium]|nr:hypothetical protein [Candidatus Limnocylindrales bacterium]